MDKIPPGTDLWQIPFAAPPPGVKSDFEKPSDLLNIFRSFIIIFIFITTTFMIIRFRARIGRDERWRIDDWFAVATWISTTGLGVLLLNCVQKLGRSTWDISLGFLMTAWPQRVIIASAFLVVLSLLLGKLCLLALHYRFFGHINGVRYQIYWTTALCFPLLAACVIFPVLNSPPPGKPWGTPNPHAKEGSIVGMAIGIENILVDLVILYIPIPHVINMNLSRKKKGGVLAIFMTGILAIVADAVVMFYRVRLWQQIDPLRDGMIVCMCSFIEACISIVCCSMPCTAKVWKVDILSSNVFISLRSRFGSTQNSRSGGSLNEGNEDAIEKPSPKKKKRGLYSIGTFPTTTHSMTKLSRSDGIVELKSFDECHSRSGSVSGDVPEHGGKLGASAKSSLTIHDPSNYLPNHSTAV